MPLHGGPGAPCKKSWRPPDGPGWPFESTHIACLVRRLTQRQFDQYRVHSVASPGVAMLPPPSARAPDATKCYHMTVAGNNFASEDECGDSGEAAAGTCCAGAGPQSRPPCNVDWQKFLRAGTLCSGSSTLQGRGAQPLQPVWSVTSRAVVSVSVLAIFVFIHSSTDKEQ